MAQLCRRAVAQMRKSTADPEMPRAAAAMIHPRSFFKSGSERKSVRPV